MDFTDRIRCKRSSFLNFITGSVSLGNSHESIADNPQKYYFPNCLNNVSLFDHFRGLPPVPLECPTPLGVKGKFKLSILNSLF